MKIVYACGNLNSANIRLQHFLNHTDHDVKIAAYYNNHLKTIHWTLDAVENIRDKSIEEIIDRNYKNFNILFDDISNFCPDIFIIDFEPICAKISDLLEIPYVCCSGMHLLDGVQWSGKKKFFTKEKEILDTFTNAVEKFIYSPFGLLENSPDLLDGFSWILPYESNAKNIRPGLETINKNIIKNNASFNTGNSEDLLSDIKTGLKICVADSPYNPEEKLNAVFVDMLGLGMAIGQAEKDMSYAANKMNIFLNKDYSYKLLNNKYELLHERLKYV